LRQEDTALVARFDAEMETIYHTAKREIGYNAARFLTERCSQLIAGSPKQL